jgi:hypothetical protein
LIAGVFYIFLIVVLGCRDSASWLCVMSDAAGECRKIVCFARHFSLYFLSQKLIYISLFWCVRWVCTFLLPYVVFIYELRPSVFQLATHFSPIYPIGPSRCSWQALLLPSMSWYGEKHILLIINIVCSLCQY